MECLPVMKKPQHMLNSQANALVTLIAQTSLDPADFEWSETALTDHMDRDYVTDMVTYQSEETFFVFGRTSVVYQPGNQRLKESWGADDWQTQVRYFAHWLANIKREAVPSLWESVTASATLPADALGVPDTPFTPEEQVEILRRLEGMAVQIEALAELTREQKRSLNAKLRELGKAVGHMNRGAWRDLAIGGVLSVLLATDVNHTVAASLLRWAVSMFHSAITGGAAPPLQLTP